jgi:hypothetical protein
MHRDLASKRKREQRQKRGQIIINKPLNVVSNNFQDELVPNNVPDVKQGNDRVRTAESISKIDL